jgi:hypothetical protein
MEVCMDAPAPGWRTAITHYSEESPATILANPDNFRRHPEEQRDALRSVIRAVGYVFPVIVNDTTGHLIDGHMRVEEAKAAGVERIQVAHVQITPEQEAVALAAYDAVAAMAYEDIKAARDLYGRITEPGAMTALLDRLAARYAPPVDEPTQTLDYSDTTILEGTTRADTFENYETTDARQIVVGMSQEDYDRVIPRLEAVQKAVGADTQWGALKALLEHATA